MPGPQRRGATGAGGGERRGGGRDRDNRRDGGAEKTAKQFDVAFLGSIQLDPEIRRAGDSGSPAVLMGEDSPHAKSLFEFARKVVARVEEIKSSSSESVIQIQ